MVTCLVEATPYRGYPTAATTGEVGAGTVDPGRLAGADTAHLLRLAAHGNKAALMAIVDRFDSLLWSVVRGFRLADAEAADAVQTTWLRLMENLGTIRNPERLPGWLRTTTQRVCIETIRRTRREYQLHGRELGVAEDREADRYYTEPEAVAVRKERVAMVRRAVQELPERHREHRAYPRSRPGAAAHRSRGSRPPGPVRRLTPARHLVPGTSSPTLGRVLGVVRDVRLGAGPSVGDLGIFLGGPGRLQGFGQEVHQVVLVVVPAAVWTRHSAPPPAERNARRA
jgi:RNA polymerase sigma factor (sigma-70 family)